MSRKKTLLQSTLCSTAFWTVNKKLAKKIGILPTVLLQHLLEIRSYPNMPDEFYQQKERIMEDLSFSKNSFDKSVETLKSFNFITVTRKSIPFKNYFKINDEIIIEFLSNEDEYSSKSEPSTRPNPNRVLGSPVTELAVSELPSNTNKQETNKIDTKKIDTKKESTSLENKETLHASTKLESCASMARSFNDEEFAQEIFSETKQENTSNSVSTLDIELDEVIEQETKHELVLQTSASGREHFSPQQDIQLDNSFMPHVINRDNVSCYSCIAQYKKIVNGKLEDKICKDKLFIPTQDIPLMSIDNVAFKLNQWRGQNNIFFVEKQKIVLQSISCEFVNGNEKVFSKFYS